MADLPPIRLAAAADGPMAQGKVRLPLGEDRLEVEVVEPSGPTSLEALLPVFQGLANAMTDIGVRRAEAAGERVSCRAGCGACCRQAVPISEPEARALARLVEALPEPRRGELRARFEAALTELAAAGLLERLEALDLGDADDVTAFGTAYLRARVPCPFLEAESCSIHPERPLACREYLVTSDPAQCAFPARDRVKGVELPGQASRALQHIGRAATPTGRMLLVQALDWARDAPEPPPDRPGPELVQAVFADLVRG